MQIPTDPHILLSYINTKLRDEYNSIDELCTDLDINRSNIEKVLFTIDYIYSLKLNRFTPL
jgi:hypothetical protein